MHEFFLTVLSALCGEEKHDSLFSPFSESYPPGDPHFRYGIIILMDPNIIGVRFTKVGKIYHFDSTAVMAAGGL
jgi:hypothetical protein